MRKVKVLCSFIVEVEMSEEDYKRRHFILEDNGCPGTGIVGAELDRVIEESDDKEICWACLLSGQNRIIQDDDTTCRHTPMPKD